MGDVLIPSAGVTEEILRFSARIHNGFPPDTAFPKMDIFSDAVEKLCAIFAKYNAQSHFRLRLLHRHTTIPDGQVLLGVSIAEDLGFWTKSTPIFDVDLERIHPHVLSVNTTTSSNEDKNDAMLFPSEFREGPPVSTDIDAHFFTEIANCLCANNLEHSIGLEAIQGQSEKMMEFSFDAGSLLLKEAVVKGQFDFLETVWAVTEDGAVDKDGETRCVIVQGQHHKVTKAKANGASDVLRILEAEGVVVLPAKV